MEHITNKNQSWGLVSRTFHWLAALLIVCMLCIGLIMANMDDSSEKFQLFALHKSTGIVVLGLMILRVIWRLTQTIPDLPLKDLLSRLSAPTLYVVVLMMPISGIIMSQAGGHPISVYGVFTLPTLIEKNPGIGKLFWQIHGYTGKILIALICLHITAALYHQLVLKNNLLRRMIKGY